MAGESYSAGGIRTTVARDPRRDRRAADRPRRAAGRRDAPAGHHHRRDQERLRPDRPRRGPVAGGGPAVHRRDHLPRCARGAGGHRAGGVRRPGDRADAGGRRAARTLDRRVLRARRLRRRPGAARSSRPVPRPGCCRGCTPTSSARDPAYAWPASSASPPSTTAPTSRTPTSTRSPPAAPSRRCCRAWSSPPGSPGPTPVGCSMPGSGSRWRPTATRVPASPARCRSASHSRSGTWG